MEKLNKKSIKAALQKMDELSLKSFELIIGGGAAMLYCYGSPLGTWDIDAIPKKISYPEIQDLIQQVSKQLHLPRDWLNTWYSSFTHTLPKEFLHRLKQIFKGKKLQAFALGPEDMLILKCCAHRAKDVSHARTLVQNHADSSMVMKHLEFLRKKRILPDDQAIEFLEDIMEECNIKHLK